MKLHPSTAALSFAIALSVASAAAAAPDDLQTAFRTAFGGAAGRHVVQPAHPLGARRGDSYREGPVDLILKPTLLTPLGGDRYVLVVFETDTVGAHLDPGAVAIAYMRRSGERWTLETVWPEFVWTGDTGHPADAMKVLSFSNPPILALTSDDMAQGQASDTTWIVRLGAKGPEFLGSVPSRGHMEGDACTGCEPYRYTGLIGPPRRAGDTLSVTYMGREAAPHGGWRPIHGATDFRSRGGELVATRRVVLPWLTIGRDEVGSKTATARKRSLHVSRSTPHDGR